MWATSGISLSTWSKPKTFSEGGLLSDVRRLNFVMTNFFIHPGPNVTARPSTVMLRLSWQTSKTHSKKCGIKKPRSRTPVRAQFVKVGRVTKPATKFNHPALLRNPPPANVFGSNRVDKLLIIKINKFLASRRHKVQQQHGWTKSNWKHTVGPLAAAIWSMYDLEAQLIQPARISCMLVFAEGAKLGNPEKNPQSREENQH